jgi:hypothetical protein
MFIMLSTKNDEWMDSRGSFVLEEYVSDFPAAHVRCATQPTFEANPRISIGPSSSNVWKWWQCSASSLSKATLNTNQCFPLHSFAKT